MQIPFANAFKGNSANKDENADHPPEGKGDYEERKIVAWIKNRVQETRSSSSRITHEGIWMTNIAYMLGYDSVYYDTSTRQWKAVGQNSNYLRRNRIHVNKILPNVQNRLSRLCKNPPRFDTRPNSANTEDKDAARLSNDVLMMVMENERYREKQIVLYSWVQQCGHAYLKVGFDDTAGEMMVNPETKERDNEGEIRLEILSAFEVFPDPLAKDMDGANYVTLCKVRKLDYFQTKWPEKGVEVQEEDAWLLSAQYEARINSLNNQGPTSSGVSQVALRNAAIEMVYYEKASKKRPNGRMITCANGILLEDKELPVGKIPIVKFDDTIVAGKFYSESLITHARPMQDQYNRTIAKRAEWTNKLLAGKS